MTAVGPRALLGLAVSASACEQLERVSEPDDDAHIPTAVQAIFDESCALAGDCHGGSRMPDLRAGASAAIIGGPSSVGVPYVDLGNLDNSYLAAAIMDDPPGDLPREFERMPKPPGMLTGTDEAVILGWIAGATILEDDGTTGDGGAIEPVACAIEDVAADEAAITSVDAADEAGKIPAQIGALLEANCGCHYVSETRETFAAYPGNRAMATLADFDVVIGIETTRDAALRRLQDDMYPMPPMPCATAEGDPILAADRVVLQDWLEAGTPDGRTWSGG